MPRVLTFEVPPGKPVLRGHDHYWRIIRELDRLGPWTVTAIRERCGGRVDRSTIRDFVNRLVAGEIAHVDEHGPAGVLYRLRRSPLATPCLRRDGSAGLQGRGQAAMWNVMRGPVGRNGFTVQELALWASTASVAVKPASASSYVKHLAQAGYFLRLRKGKSGTPASYKLKPDLAEGVLPPLVLRSQIVFDQNRNTAMAPIQAREVEL